MNWLDAFLDNKIIDATVSALTVKSMILAGFLAPAFAILSFSFNLASHVLQGKPRFLDYNQVARCLIILSLIGSYPAIMWFINLPITAGLEIFQDLNPTELAKNISEQTKSGPVTEIGLLSGLVNMFGNFFDTILTSVFSGVALLIYFVIRVFLAMIIKVLYIVGPLAFALALIPMFKDQMSTWISAYVSTSCCLITQDILRRLLDIAVETSKIGITAANSESHLWASQIFNITVVALHISVFWLTKQWVGSASAGAVFSNAISAMSAAAGAKLGALAGQGGNGNSSPTNTDNAVDTFEKKS